MIGFLELIPYITQATLFYYNMTWKFDNLKIMLLLIIIINYINYIDRYIF